MKIPSWYWSMFLAHFLACSRFVDESLKIIDFRTLIVLLVPSCFYFGYFNLEKTLRTKSSAVTWLTYKVQGIKRNISLGCLVISRSHGVVPKYTRKMFSDVPLNRLSRKWLLRSYWSKSIAMSIRKKQSVSCIEQMVRSVYAMRQAYCLRKPFIADRKKWDWNLYQCETKITSIQRDYECNREFVGLMGEAQNYSVKHYFKLIKLTIFYFLFRADFLIGLYKINSPSWH